MNLKNWKFGLIAEYSKDNEKVITDHTTMCLADHFVSHGAEVIVMPWRQIISKSSIFFNMKTRSEINPVDLKETVEHIHLRDIGEIETEQKDFKSLLDILSESKIPVSNSLQAIRDNLSKRYLIDFFQSGLPVAPLTIVDSYDSLKKWQSSIGKCFSDIVLKPLEFGELGSGVYRLSEISDEFACKLLDQGREYLAQEFLPEIAAGEKRLVFVGKSFSHAVLKGIVDGFKQGKKDLVTPYQPTKAEIEIGLRVIDHLGFELDLMRIDLVGDEENCKIIEVELINPNLHELEADSIERYSNLLTNHFFKKYYLK